MLRAVFFDVGGTLAHPRPSFHGLLARACRERGLSVTARAAARAESAVWAKIAEQEERARGFTLSPERSRDFWFWVYRLFLSELGYEPADDLLKHLFATFSRPEAYQLYDDAIPTLDSLRRAGLTLGLISNWEAWAERLVERLQIQQYFRCAIISGLAGVEKPDPAIFWRALTEADVEPGEAIYVGDDPERDVQAAQRVGIRAVLLDRDSRPRVVPLGGRDDHQPGERIRSLLELPNLLGL